MFKILRHFCCLVVVLLCCAQAQAGVVVDVPQAVTPGQAFRTVISSDTALDDVFVEWNGISVPVPMRQVKDGWRGEALLGAAFDMKGDAAFLRVSTVSGAGYNVYRREMQVAHKQYAEQHLDVDRKYVELAKKDLDRHHAERARVKEALAHMSAMQEWALPLLRPVPGDVSSEYGLTRFFNGKPRNPHKGLDLRGAAGTPIKACADGVVVLAESHFFAGNSVYIDHGQGVVSMYFHMSSIGVKPGQHVARGQTIGKVGKTGRVTGPHLHFGVSVQGELVDPAPLLADS